jgi:polyisoprenoid-binding protein YceI
VGEPADRGDYAPRVPSLQAGTYTLGPENGTLSVRTRRSGAAAKAGHDLLLHVTAWEARLAVGTDVARTSLELDVDATSLRVIEGTGGMKALDDDDRANIRQTIDEEVLKRQDVTFRSTRIQPAEDGGFRVEGDLTLLGTTRPLAFVVAVTTDDALSATAVVTQSSWGMKPYSTLFGALKVVDEVEVAIAVHLPAPQP